MSSSIVDGTPDDGPATSSSPPCGCRVGDQAWQAGVRRRLDRLATSTGHFCVVAIDHPVQMLNAGADVLSVPEARTFKATLLDQVDGLASAIILDPDLGLPAAFTLAAVPSGGLVVNAECYTDDRRPAGRRARWEPCHMAATGADAVKYAFMVESDPPAREQQEQDILDLIAACHAHGLAVVLEPLLEPVLDVPAEDRRRWVDDLVEAARRVAALGADVMKLQFPGSVGSDAEERRARAACVQLGAAFEQPWVVLSQGIGSDAFARQVAIAAHAGASGFMVGRSLWGDVEVAPPFTGLDALGSRLTQLVELAAAGTPWRQRGQHDAWSPATQQPWWTT